MASNDEQRSATTIFTTAAQSIAARLIANKTTAKFTKAEISTTNLFNQSVTELQVLTSLDNVQQTADINTVKVINDSTVDVNIAIDQTKAPNDYQMNSVGLYAKDGDGKEVLYSVTVLKDPVYIHQDAMGSALGIDLETVVGQSSNVDLSINPAGAVTNEALKVTLADYVKTDEVKSLIPATVIDGSKPADFKEAVTLEKGAVDGAGNVIATTKNLADGDAETLKSAKEYADTQASGKADDSKVVHKTGDEEISGSKTFDTAPVDKTTGNPYITVTDLNNGLSTKVTDNKNGTITANNLTYDLPKTGLTAISLYSSGSFNDLPLGTVFASSSVTDGPDKTHSFTVTTSYFSGWSGRKAQIAIADSENLMYFRVWNAGGWHSWVLLSDDSKVVHSADMRKPASDVAGIEEVNAKQDKIGYTPANAANVVDRNPDTGVVSEPVDFTKLTVNGGKSVATSDDLKSLEDASWRQLDNKYIVPASGHTVGPATTILYKIDDSNHKLYLSGSIVLTANSDNVQVTVQLGSIIKSILTSSVTYLGYFGGSNFMRFVSASQSSTNLAFFVESGTACIVSTLGTEGKLACVTYDELL